MTKTCFGYIRVSTAKQGEGVSLEAQHDAITAFAEKNDLTITQWFEEKETAAKRGRPIFDEMMRALKKGKADALVVHKIDRSARNFYDWAKIGELADLGVDIHFATESLDFRSRGGRLAADIQAVVAADYIRNLRDEALKGTKGRLKQGLSPFKAPVGYRDNGGGQPKTIDPETGPLVRQMFELYASGQHSIRSLISEMDVAGLRSKFGKPLNKSGIERIISNPFYCGIIEVRTTGETYPGIHEPLISPSLFQRTQDIRADRYRQKVTRHNYTYRGQFKCGICKNAMIAEGQKGHVYYRCHTPQCPTKTIREDVLELEIVRLLRGNEINSAARVVLKDRFSTERAERDRQQSGPPADIEVARIDARIHKLTDALISGLIDDEIYRTKHRELLMQRQISQERVSQRVDADRALIRIGKFLELAKNLAGLYEIALPAEKRQIVEITTSNREVARKNVVISPQTWLSNPIFLPVVPYGGRYEPKDRNGRQCPEPDTGVSIELQVMADMERLTKILELVDDRSRNVRN